MAMYSLKTAREDLFARASAIFDFIKAAAVTEYVAARAKWRRLEQIEKEFNDIHFKIIEYNGTVTDPANVLATSRIAFDDVVDGIHVLMAKLEDRHLSKQSVAGGSGTPKQNESFTHRPKLPEVKIPTYSGELSEWTNFKSLFDSIVHKTNLSPVEKFTYLKSVLSGEPLALISHYEFTDENYELAYKTLETRYENKRILANTYSNQLLNYQQTNLSTIQALRQYNSVHVDSINKLRALKLENESDFLLFQICYNHLDNKLKARFNETHSTDNIPTYAALAEFIQKTLRNLELQQNCTDSANSSTSPKEKFRNKSFVSQKVNENETPLKYPCAKCNKSHFLSDCTEYNKLLLVEKLSFLENIDACLNCLGRHNTEACYSRYRCRQCKGKHHTSLHKDPEPNQAECTGSPVSLRATSSRPGLQVILSTAIVYIRDAAGVYQPCRSLLDSCSEISAVTKACARRLGLSVSYSSSTSISGIGNSPTNAQGLAKFSICSPTSNWRVNRHVNAYVLDNITTPLPTATLPSSATEHFAEIKLADPDWFTTGPIDLLLGADIYASLLIPKPPVIKGSLTAIPTMFGSVIMGSVPNLDKSSHEPISLLTLQPSLENALRNFWESEEIDPVIATNPDDINCENNFIANHSRTADGRYVVCFPWKDANRNLGNNRKMAFNSYISLERRMQSNGYYDSYYKFMKEYLELGHMRRAVTPSSYIIPHHAVIKNSSSTTKLRVVFNGSYVSNNGKSLNDLLASGSKLQSDLTQLLFTFRLHKIALCADIKMMYRQILVQDADAAFQHIFWRPSPTDTIQEFELLTVTYGLGPSAFLAQRTVRQVVHDEGSDFPLASNALLNETYVDDVTSGADDIEEVLQLRDQLISLLSRGGFELRKWLSSDPRALVSLSQEHLEATLNFDSDESFVKILGLSWEPTTDSFKYTVEHFKGVPTKRSILSYLARTFDPMGWLMPLVIWIKSFLQKLWINSQDWDQELSPNLLKEWNLFSQQLPTLTHLRIPRYMGLPAAVYTLVGFADASGMAMAACVYLVSRNQSGTHVSLVQAKSKVAPLKPQSISRLELNAALLLIKLVKVLVSRNPSIFTSIHLFTDSQNVLYWLETPPHLLKMYVANRTFQIREITKDINCHWHYVNTKENPADCASRGLFPSQFLEHKLWLNGPQFLKDPVDSWPIWHSKDIPEDAELKPVTVLAAQQSPSNPLISVLDRVSDYRKLIKIIAYVLRFIGMSCKLATYQAHLSITEQQDALRNIIKLVQEKEFAEDIKLIKAGKASLSSLKRLSPFLDDFGIIRVGGRLENSSLSYNTRHPPILPKSSPLTRLIIEHHHAHSSLHSGASLVQALVHREFWVISSRTLVRQVIRKCVRCVRFKARTVQPEMGSLPSSRVSPNPVFSVVGVDFAGPFNVKEGRRRNSPTSKNYLCVFVCHSTKAVHLEIVSSLPTDAFLAAFDRFTSRRGTPAQIITDNGSNFLGAKRLLSEAAQFLKDHSDEIISSLATRGVEWKFNPPYASHFGGIFEAVVKSAKHLLLKTMGDSSFYFEELTTIFTRIEGILNSRPLTALPDETDPDSDYLTPGHFLIGRPILSPPELPIPESMTPRCRWQKIKQTVQSFWKKWSSQYLNTQIQRKKWHRPSSNLTVGQIVVVPDVRTSVMSWPLGRILEVHPGCDGTVRVVTVLCHGQKFKRSSNKLVLLPVDEV